MSGGLAAGLRLGAYRLLFHLGAGGMGEVWAAQRAGGRVVALKIMGGLGLPAEQESMFVDEAKLALTLRHKNIVQTLEVSQSDGRPFIVMELIRGPAASVFLRRANEMKAQPAPAVVAHVGLRVANALAFAHDELSLRGKPLRLVHRDISPHNLLFETSGKVLLTDFGVARTSMQEHHTVAGTVRGKPAYMAPEQVQLEDPDHRSDLFSLGIVLYELATVERLFGRGSAIGSMRAVVNDPAPRIDAKVPGFPKAFADLVERMLAKDRNQRPASAREVADSLAAQFGDDIEQEAGLAELIGRLFPGDAFNVEERVGSLPAEESGTVTIPEVTRGAHDWPTTALAEPLLVEAAGGPPAPKPIARLTLPNPTSAEPARKSATPRPDLGQIRLELPFQGTDALAPPTVQGSRPTKDKNPVWLMLAGTALLSSALSVAGTLWWVSSQTPEAAHERSELEPTAPPVTPPPSIEPPSLPRLNEPIARPDPLPVPPVRPPPIEPVREPVTIARDETPNEKEASKILSRGKRALFDGDLQRSEKLLLDCLDLVPNQPECHRALASLYTLKRESGQAAYHHARYLELEKKR